MVKNIFPTENGIQRDIVFLQSYNAYGIMKLGLSVLIGRVIQYIRKPLSLFRWGIYVNLVKTFSRTYL